MSQTEMFAEVPASVPFYAGPTFVQLRAVAESKPNVHKPIARIKLGEARLLDAVRATGLFVDIAQAMPDVYWSEVFRDLLRARARGLVRYAGDDRWEVVE